MGRDGARIDRTARPAATPGRGDRFFRNPEFAGLRQRYGFVSGTSTHADRLATIRSVEAADGIVIDPHTADAVKVAHDLRGKLDGPIIVTETALPVKFSATIVEALGHEPERPAAFAGLEDLPRRMAEIPADAEVVKRLIEHHLAAQG